MNKIEFQGHEVIELKVGPSTALFAPQFGGRLLKWDLGDTPIVHWPNDANWGRVAGVRGGNPLLFPFIARHMVRGEIGKWIDQDNYVRDLPMHGFARDLPFTVDEADSGADRLTMSLVAKPALEGAYPFSFRFTASYTLSEDTLSCTLTTSNTGDKELPYYAGHHFYLHLPRDQRNHWWLDLDYRESVRQDKEGNIYSAAPARGPLHVNDPEILDQMHVLNSQKPARLYHDDGREIEFLLDFPGSLPWHAVTTWTESAESDFFCVEPWLGLPNAIHHGIGLRKLAGGNTETATCALRLKN